MLMVDKRKCLTYRRVLLADVGGEDNKFELHKLPEIRHGLFQFRSDNQIA